MNHLPAQVAFVLVFDPFTTWCLLPGGLAEARLEPHPGHSTADVALDQPSDPIKGLLTQTTARDFDLDGHLSGTMECILGFHSMAIGQYTAPESIEYVVLITRCIPHRIGSTDSPSQAIIFVKGLAQTPSLQVEHLDTFGFTETLVERDGLAHAFLPLLFAKGHRIELHVLFSTVTMERGFYLPPLIKDEGGFYRQGSALQPVSAGFFDELARRVVLRRVNPA